eukprot:UN02888
MFLKYAWVCVTLSDYSKLQFLKIRKYFRFFRFQTIL